MEQALRWYEHAIASLSELARFPERHGLSRENDDFPYVIRDFLFGLGSRPSYRAIFTIHGDTVHVLTVRRGSEDRVHPDELDFNADL